MKVIFLILALSGTLFAQQKTAGPRYCTGKQVKIYWYNQFPIPPTMDRNYSRAVKDRDYFVEQVRAGNYDLYADRAAAAYNSEVALAAGDTDRATFYREDVARFDEAIAAALEAEKKQLARMLEVALRAEIMARNERIRREISVIRMNLQSQLNR